MFIEFFRNTTVQDAVANMLGIPKQKGDLFTKKILPAPSGGLYLAGTIYVELVIQDQNINSSISERRKLCGNLKDRDISEAFFINFPNKV